MSEITHYAFGLVGFVAGMFVWTQITRWVTLIVVSGSKHGGDFLGEPRRRLAWVVPLVSLLHPAPWILCASIVVTFMTIRGGTQNGWTWFFAGLWFGVLMMLFMTGIVLARLRRARIEKEKRDMRPRLGE